MFRTAALLPDEARHRPSILESRGGCAQAHKIASTVESVQDGRIHIELVNLPFLQAGGSPDEYRAGIERAIANGWLTRHRSALM
jgi:hypothetical protein